jgi:integrase
MFNEERKRWFINDSDYIASTVWVLEQLFNTTERIENQKNKDLCEFSPKDVIDLLRSFNSKSRKTLGSKCSYLAKYYNWCLQKGFTDDIENKFETSIVKNVIEDLVPADMLNRKIFTFKDIDELITDIPQVEYKCFIYCIFSGLSIQDIRYLRMQD